MDVAYATRCLKELTCAGVRLNWYHSEGNGVVITLEPSSSTGVRILRPAAASSFKHHPLDLADSASRDISQPRYLVTSFQNSLSSLSVYSSFKIEHSTVSHSISRAKNSVFLTACVSPPAGQRRFSFSRQRIISLRQVNWIPSHQSQQSTEGIRLSAW